MALSHKRLLSESGGRADSAYGRGTLTIRTADKQSDEVIDGFKSNVNKLRSLILKLCDDSTIQQFILGRANSQLPSKDTFYSSLILSNNLLNGELLEVSTNKVLPCRMEHVVTPVRCHKREGAAEESDGRVPL